MTFIIGDTMDYVKLIVENKEIIGYAAMGLATAWFWQRTGKPINDL